MHRDWIMPIEWKRPTLKCQDEIRQKWIDDQDLTIASWRQRSDFASNIRQRSFGKAAVHSKPTRIESFAKGSRYENNDWKPLSLFLKERDSMRHRRHPCWLAMEFIGDANVNVNGHKKRITFLDLRFSQIICSVFLWSIRTQYLSYWNMQSINNETDNRG